MPATSSTCLPPFLLTPVFRSQNPRRGGTALHIAANEGNMEMARFLVSAGADLNAQDLYVAARLLIRFNNHLN